MREIARNPGLRRRDRPGGDASSVSGKGDAGLAYEIAECARLIKGYGDTHKRGVSNYQLIVSELIRPALAGSISPHRAAEAIANARTAALLDPEGEALARCLADIQSQWGRRIAAE